MNLNFFRNLPKPSLVLLLILTVQACDKKDPDPVVPTGAAGYFVVNEGNFGHSNTSLSFYDREKNIMTNDIYAASNGHALGDQAQSAAVFEGKVYITVQNSGTVEVIGADDFKSIKTITESIESPRFFVGISASKGYVSDWGADGLHGTVRVIDLESMAVIKTINTGKGANKMVMKDGKVYVANAGGYGTDNKIKIIDTSTDAVVDSITVMDNPNGIVFDKNGYLWVSGSGDYVSTPSWLARVDPAKKEIVASWEVTFAGGVTVNNAADKIYAIYQGGIFQYEPDATELSDVPIIPGTFYGLAVDPTTDDIICTDVKDYTSNGSVYVFDSTGTQKVSYDVGIIPGNIAFK